MRFFLSLLFAFFFVACSHVGSSSDSAYEHLVVVGTNDVHGHIRVEEKNLGGGQILLRGGAEWFAGYVNILRQKFGDHLLLLDGGDLFQGTLDSNFFYGAPIVDIYNYLHYNASAVGNHEFDYGNGRSGSPDRLKIVKERFAQAQFPFLAANIYEKRTKNVWREKNLFPHKMIEVAGVRIGIFGLTTVTTVAKTLPINIAHLDFGDFAEAAKREAAELRTEGADIVLLATHDGDDVLHPLQEMLQKLAPGTIDAIVAGHTHTEIHKFIEGVPVIESRTQGKFFGRIDLFINKKTKRVEKSLTKIQEMHSICGNWLADAEECDPSKARGTSSLPLRPAFYEGIKVEADLKVRNILAPYFEKVNGQRGEKLGMIERDFKYLPDGESEVGTIFATALLNKFPKAKVVYMNGGGFRKLFSKGTLSYGDLYEVLPFDNSATEVEMTGKEFKKMLKIGVSGVQRVPSVAGVTMTIHKIEESLAADAWTKDKLVSVKWPNGKEMSDNESFTVVTTDYLVSGGDHCDTVFDAIPASRKHFSGDSVRDITADYLRKHPGLVLSGDMVPHFKIVP